MQFPSLASRTLLAAGAAVLVGLCALLPLVGTVAAAFVVLAMAPLGRTLPARVGTLLLLWLAWSQFAYVLPWPSGLPPRQAVAWGLVAAGVLVWHAVQADRTPARRLLPEPTAGGAALVVFVATVAWWFWPWSGDADHVLDRMLLGWDHSGHFGMVEQLHVPSAAAVDAFAGYPRGYHALVASLMELGSGPAGAMGTELVAYAYGCLAVMGSSLVLLAALALDAPAFRRRPALLLPAVATLVTVLLQLDDASQVPYYGFGNFLEAAALAGAGMLLPLGWARRSDAWRWFLLGTAAAGVIATWPLLLVFLVPVPVAVWLARRPGETGVPRRLLSSAWTLVVPVLAAVLAQPPAVRAVTAGAEPAAGPLAALDRFLLLDGAIRTSSLGWPMVFPLAGLGASLLLLVLRRRIYRAPGVREVAWLWLMPLAALSASWAMLGYEYARVGAPRYYGIKVLCATTIAAGSLAVVSVATFVDALLPQRRARNLVAAASALLAAWMLVCAGTPVRIGPFPMSAGGAVRADLASSGPELRRPLAQAIQQACGAISGRPGEYYLLVPGTNHEDLVRANVWIITCGLDWGSPDHSPVLRELIPDRVDNGGNMIVDITADTEHILSVRPNARVVVPRNAEAQARMGLTLGQAQRLVVY